MGDASEHLAVQQVMLNYSAGVDERDMERYGNCFIEDVEIVGFGDTTFHSRDTWLDYVSAALDKYSATQHLLGPVHSVINGDSATARTDVQATHFLAGGGGRFTLWATYHTQMRRSEGQWLIARHELKVCGTHTE